LVHFLLYSRSYCHLCDDMLQALQAWQERYAFTVEVVDVDADEELVARYDELVPVLIGSKNGSESVEICHYFLDHEKLQTFLAS
jgi:thiol-disulfide isomerase/thioredoxin